MKHIAMVSHSAVTETNRYFNPLENLKQGWDKKLNPFLK
jgi:sortase (surface protein transpeptidase)